MAKVEPFQSSFDAKIMMRHAFPWQHQSWHEWNVAWMENPALNYNSAVSKDYGNVSLAYFYSWLLTSSIVCLILSKIIPSISTTACTALRVTGLLEPIEPINNEDTWRTCKGHTERPWVSKKSRRWQSEPLLCRVTLDSLPTTLPSRPYLHIFFAAVLLVRKGSWLKKEIAKQKK